MFNQNELHVVYASDDKFAEILGVSLVSLLDNNQDMEQIHIYVLDSGVSDDNKEKIESLCEKYDRVLPKWIPATNISKALNVDVIADRGSLSQYARLFISSVMPETLSRVLYLDCDIIVNESLSELWNLDLQGNTIGALMDAFSKQYRANIDLEPMDVMFNSGVMLVDLNQWKERDIEGRLKDFIIKKKGKIQQGDQGALNAVLSKDTYCFEPRFNSVTIYYDFSYQEMMVYRKPPEFYSEEQIIEAVEHPVLIHYTTSFLSRRPWIEGCKHQYVAVWLKYKNMTPWDTKPLWKYQKKTGIAGVYTTVIKKMPRKIMIWFSGVLQAYGRPLLLKYKYHE